MLLLLAGQGLYVWLYGAGRDGGPIPEGAARQPGRGDGPRVAVILCVRGTDPSLARCLDAIDAQTHPNFGIIIGLDSTADPAWAQVGKFQETAAHSVHIHVLKKIPEHCSLKCAVLAEIIDSLPASIISVALIDADSVVGRDWLERLTVPLNDEGVGAVSGTRWCEPAASSVPKFWGTYVRAVWNTAAVVQIQLYSIAWGGSLAMRLDTIRRLELTGQWLHQFCEDTMVTDALRSTGLRMVRPPGLLALNQETVPLSGVGSWITRQLLTVRLYNRNWPWVAAHGILVGLVATVSALVMLVAALTGAWTWLLVCVGGFAIYTVGSWGLLVRVSQLNSRPIFSATGQQLVSARRDWIRWMVAVPLTQFIHFAATLRAIFARSVRWRGIQYDLGAGKICLREYRPYETIETGPEHSVH